MAPQRPYGVFRIAALASTMAIVTAGSVLAQEERCEGTVTDDAGAPLAGVTITFTHLGTNVKGQVKTSKKGKYAHNTLEANTSPGYEIRATLEGYKIVRISAYSCKQDGTSVTTDTQRGGPDTYMVGAKQEGLHKVAVPAQARSVTGSRGKCVVDFVMAAEDNFVEVFNKLRAEQLAKEGKTPEPVAQGAAPSGGAAPAAPVTPAGPSALETARSRVSNGEYEGAVEPARKAVADDPGSAEAYKLLGMSLAKTKNIAEAEPALKKAIELDPALVGPNFEMGMLYIERGRNMQAIPYFEKELELTPDSTALLQNLGKLYADTEQFDKAIAAYEKLIGLDPDAIEFYGLLADAYKRSGNTAKELEAYKKMGDLDPSGMAFYNLGNIMFNKSEMAQAAEAYKKAVAQAPDNASAHFQLGMTYVNLAKFKEAVAELETFIKLKPKDPKAAEAKSMVAELRKMGG